MRQEFRIGAFARRSVRRAVFHLSRLLSPIVTTSSKLGFPLQISGQAAKTSTQDLTIHHVLDHHFRLDLSNHICKSTFTAALCALNEKPAVIVETGSSAWGANSSQLLDEYVHVFGGKFFTVDSRIQPMLDLRKALGSHSMCTCDDSVRFLKRWHRDNGTNSVDLVYLDSWDLDLNDPLPAGIHGLKEFMAIKPCLRDGSIVLIDDTPRDLSYFDGRALELARKFEFQTGMMPGKGSLVLKSIADDSRFEILAHEYQVVLRYNEKRDG